MDMLLPALEADLVERMRSDGRTCRIRVGRTLGAGDPVTGWPSLEWLAFGFLRAFFELF